MILDIMGKRTFLSVQGKRTSTAPKASWPSSHERAPVAPRPDEMDDGVRDSVGPCPVYALGNKTDLAHRREGQLGGRIDRPGLLRMPGPLHVRQSPEERRAGLSGSAKTIVESMAPE